MASRLSLSKKREILRNGKEESYERNPGRVPLVFNHKFVEPLEGSTNLPSKSKKLFDLLGGRPMASRLFLLICGPPVPEAPGKTGTDGIRPLPHGEY